MNSALFLFCLVGFVASQTDLIEDPGFITRALDQCDPNSVWYFRADYLWNDTVQNFDARCDAFVELPTDTVPGLTKGEQTNINKAEIPDLPTVTGNPVEYPESAIVIDMNTPCRAALWNPFTITSTGATAALSFKLWVRSNPNIAQNLFDGSEASTADLLQYLREPDGLLTTVNFPFPTRENTNMLRVDVMLPDASGSFFDRSFSLIEDQIAGQVEIPDWTDGEVVPDAGTDGLWVQVDADISGIVSTPGTYALRFASAQSQTGVSWGVTDVHLEVSGGTKKRDARSERFERSVSHNEEKVKIVGKVRRVTGQPLRK